MTSWLLLRLGLELRCSALRRNGFGAGGPVWSRLLLPLGFWLQVLRTWLGQGSAVSRLLCLEGLGFELRCAVVCLGFGLHCSALWPWLGLGLELRWSWAELGSLFLLLLLRRGLVLWPWLRLGSVGSQLLRVGLELRLGFELRRRALRSSAELEFRLLL